MALPAAPSHLEATVDAATPPAHPAVITPLLAMVAATSLPHRPATASVPLHAAAAAEVVAVVEVVVEVANRITVEVVVVAVVVTGPPHRDVRPPRLMSTHHRAVAAAAAAATVGAMTTPHPDAAAAGTRTTRTRVPTEAVGLVVGGITKKPIEGVR